MPIVTAGALCARTGRAISVQDAQQNHFVTARMRGFGDYDCDGTASTVKARDYKEANDLVAFQSNANACDAAAAGDNVSPTVRSKDSPAVAFHENSRAELRETDIAGSMSTEGGKPGQGYPAVRNGMSVRRLTPIECERLQGFPDGYTDVKEKTPDGPRYKAIGNSMAVPVMSWIGQRIDLIDRLI
jgi:DNA (cytosine-5)-methyltransferase 1